MSIDSASSSIFANIPMEVLVPFMVGYMMRVADDLYALFAPVAEWWEANRAAIECLEQLLDHTGVPT